MNKAAHKLLFNLEFESANMIVQDGVMLAALYAPASTSTCGFVDSSHSTARQRRL